MAGIPAPTRDTISLRRVDEAPEGVELSEGEALFQTELNGDDKTDYVTFRIDTDNEKAGKNADRSDLKPERYIMSSGDGYSSVETPEEVWVPERRFFHRGTWVYSTDHKDDIFRIGDELQTIPILSQKPNIDSLGGQVVDFGFRFYTHHTDFSHINGEAAAIFADGTSQNIGFLEKTKESGE